MVIGNHQTISKIIEKWSDKYPDGIWSVEVIKHNNKKLEIFSLIFQ
jgi:hypothetical protein